MTDPTYRLLVAATFTADPIERVLAFLAGELGLPAQVSFTPYGQVFQQLLDPDSTLARNRTGANVLVVRPSDLVRGADDRHAAEELAVAIRDAASRWSVPAAVVVCPSPGDAGTALVAGLRGHVGVIGPDELERWYPGGLVADPYAERLGHVPYTDSGFTALGTAVARVVHRLRTPAPKVVVVDADHTLWDGVAGEGGRVEVGAARRSLQGFLLGQRRAGRLLCLCSRNTEADTMAVLGEHPGMLLRPEDFTAVRVNWESKADNLRGLAEELGLGLDSFVFIDDSPVECAEVRARCPEALVLQVPADPADADRFLRHSWALDIGATTEDDARRADRYRTEAARDRERRAAPSLGEFLESLDLRVSVEPASAGDVARVAQLTGRTNQFTLSARRYTEAEIADLGEDCLVVRAEDRFGDYGTVGAMVTASEGDALRVDAFLLSCRALGRGVEHRMLAHLGRLAAERGLSSVDLVFRATARNRPAASFAAGLGATALDGGVLRLAAASAAAAAYTPADAAPPAPVPELEVVRGPLVDTGASLATIPQIEERMRAGRLPSTGDSLDDAVAALLAEVLGLAAVGPDDNFFELGGTSIHLVRFMSAVHARFGVELPLDTLYNSELTASGVAAAVLFASLTAGESADLLAMVESMSDEQVEAALARLAPEPS